MTPRRWQHIGKINRLTLTSSLPQPAKFPGGKVDMYTPADSIFDGPVTNLSTLYILIAILSHAVVKWGSGIFVGHFPSDGVTSMAEKGLRSLSALPAIASAKTESSFLCHWLDNTLHSYSPLQPRATTERPNNMEDVIHRSLWWCAQSCHLLTAD